MSTEVSHDKFWQYVLDYKVRLALQNGIKRLYSLISTSISKAAQIVEVTPVQLRYWESLNIINLGNGSNHKLKEFDIITLKRLLLANVLISECNFTPAKISSLFTNVEDSDIDALFESLDSSGLDKEASVADQEILAQFFVPQLTNVVLNLIYSADAEGIILAPLDDIAESCLCRFRGAAGLSIAVGQPLEGYWFFASRVKEGNISVGVREFVFFENPDRYRVIPVCYSKDGGKSSIDHPGALLIGSLQNGINSEHNDSLSNRFLENDTICRLLGVIIGFVQRMPLSNQRFVFHHVYSSPSAFLDKHLNNVANLILTFDKTNCWDFCCILLPLDKSMPRSQHSLIVRGQSSKSPHTSNMTSLAPGKGISGFAYQTSQIANVSELMDGDSRIAYHEQEANVQSALAIPIGVNGSVNGVIYMAARTSHAFDRTDEQVLGIFAQLIGQLIENSQVGRMVQNHITQFMTRPKILDPLFTSFESHDAFLEDLASCIVKIRDHENGIITIMAVDMDNSTAIGELYGDNAVRQTWLGLGEKLRKYLQSSQLSQRTTNIYRTLHDRYVLILPFVSPNASVEFARQLKKTIESDPVPIYISGGEALPYPIRVKLGIVSTPATLLTEMTGSTRDIVQLLTRQLNGALRRAKEQGGSRICVWDSNKSDYNFCD